MIKRHFSYFQVVHIEFLALNMEASSKCRYDYVTLYDGPDSSYPVLGKLCGNKGIGLFDCNKCNKINVIILICICLINWKLCSKCMNGGFDSLLTEYET